MSNNPISSVDPTGLSRFFAIKVALGITGPVAGHTSASILEYNQPSEVNLLFGASSLYTGSIIAKYGNRGGPLPVYVLLLGLAAGVDIGTGLYNSNPCFYIDNVGGPMYYLIHGDLADGDSSCSNQSNNSCKNKQGENVK